MFKVLRLGSTSLLVEIGGADETTRKAWGRAFGKISTSRRFTVAWFGPITVAIIRP